MKRVISVVDGGIEIAKDLSQIEGLRTVDAAIELCGGVFTDRDGVMNEGINVDGPANFRLLPGVKKAFAKLKAAGKKYGVITNQGGLGEDIDGNIAWPNHPLTREALAAIHAEMKNQLGPNAQPDVIKFCPHLTKAKCKCRKPLPAMILEAAAEMKVDPRKSYMIGDRVTDVECGINAGAVGIFVLTGHDPEKERKLLPAGTLVFPSVVEAIDWILEQPA